MRVSFASFVAYLLCAIIISLLVLYYILWRTSALQSADTHQHNTIWEEIRSNAQSKLSDMSDSFTKYKINGTMMDTMTFLRAREQEQILLSPSSEEDDNVISSVISDVQKRLHSFAKQKTRLLMANPLTSETSHRIPLSSISTLPAFNHDRSEFALSAIIERKAEAFDLWATTFLYAHKVVIPHVESEIETFWRVDEPALSDWKQAIRQMKDTNYTDSGLRVVDPQFICRITAAVRVQGDHVYPMTESTLVEGHVIPNGGIGDLNARYRHDIVRCKLPNPKELFVSYAHSDLLLQVELIKAGYSQFIYHIPWRSRISGYMALHPDSVLHRVSDGVYKNRASKRKLSIQQLVRKNIGYALSALNIDPWKGITLPSGSEGASQQEQFALDTIYLCVPGWLSPVTTQNVPHMVEFIQHHINQGN